MSTTLDKEVYGVRDILRSPLPQSPSFRDIVHELEAEYQHVTNETNNTGNAWQVASYDLETVADQRVYEILPEDGFDYFKPLNITYIPDGSDRQHTVEMTELENIPKEWAWINQQSNPFVFASSEGQFIAFYGSIDEDGTHTNVEIRPTPDRVQTYTILYQVSDWWALIGASVGSREFTMPFSSQKFYIRSLVAQNLLMKGAVKWSTDDNYNLKMGEIVGKGLEVRIQRYNKVFEEYKLSLDHPDVVEIDSWIDSVI
jgi:hypothetical protein